MDVQSLASSLNNLAAKGQDEAEIYCQKFRKWSVLTQWNECALAAKFRDGLSEAIKDVMVGFPAPTGLNESMTMAIQIDRRLRERKPVHHLAMSSEPSPEIMQCDRIQSRSERQNYRRKKRLCFYCGDSAHVISACSKRTKKVDKSVAISTLQSKFILSVTLICSLSSISVDAYVDSGAALSLMDWSFANRCGFSLEPLEVPIPLKGIDSTPLAMNKPQYWTQVTMRMTPVHQESFMHDIFREYLDKFMIVYLDDILVFSDDWESHVQQMDPVKVQAICDWTQPTSLKSLQKFLGFANFYRCFITNFSSVVKPLTDLTKKGADVANWSPAAVEAFQELKCRFSSAPVLRQPDVSLPFQVEVDASEIGAGAVLSQRSSDGSVMKPCAFFSRKFSPAERNYDVGNRELLAMKWAFEEWRHWLEGARHRVVVLTDHKNLIYLESARRLNPRQARWSLFFSRFNFVVSYLPGSKNVKADALSRSFVPDSLGNSEPSGILRDGVILSAVSPDLRRALQEFQAGKPDRCPPERLFVPDNWTSRVISEVEPSDFPGVDMVVDRLHRIWSHVVDNLKLSQEKAQQFANRRRRVGPRLLVGDLVWLSSRFVPMKVSSPKFKPRFIGPYRILEILNPVSFRLDLPASFAIHNVFHRSLLRKYEVPVVPSLEPPAPVLVEGELEYVVEKILDSRVSRRKLQYLVKWKGYGQEDNSWVVASDVHADDLVRAFHRAHPGRPGGSRKWHLGLNCDSSNDHCHHPLNHGFDYFYGMPFSLIYECQPEGLVEIDGPFIAQLTLITQFMAFAVMTLVIVRYSNMLTINRNVIFYSALFCILFFITWYLKYGFVQYWTCIIMRNHEIIEQPMKVERTASQILREAQQFIDRINLFLLIVSFLHVHTPLITTEAFIGKSKHGLYGDNVEEMDYMVGLVVDAIDNAGLQNNTMIYFASDHGGHLEGKYNKFQSGGWNGIYRGGKSMAGWEGGIRVPGIFRWPGVIPSNVKIDEPTSLMDIYPTVVFLGGGELPTDRIIDGRNLMPLLTKKNSSFRTRVSFSLLWNYTSCSGAIWKAHFMTPVFNPDGAVGCYDILYCGCEGDQVTNHDPPLLFELSADPSESNPLDPQIEPQYSAVLKRIKIAVAEHRETISVVPMQFSFLNNVWRPWLQPCCGTFPFCWCDKEDHYDHSKRRLGIHGYDH
ncbi:unnamed protein product [Ranitomeya imitator]|uniref:Chromo domain-containing protein n=1 Tax=Ranitomeya imitator TaxID=111125 RepID=A0ABN9L8G6_9NEOB|nr:unnamed protein product [Ranitomeya imitator]